MWRRRMSWAVCLVLCVLLAGRGLRAEAAQTLMELTFEDGSLEGIGTYVEGGSCDLGNEDGQLAVYIHSCGQKDYANQVYWDGFSLEQGVTYTLSFDLSCSITRTLQYRIQLNGGDYHAYMLDTVQATEQVQHISQTFRMEEGDDPAPRLAWNLGLQSDMAEDPGEHTVWIDNVCLVNEDAQDDADDEDGGDVMSDGIYVNQVGWKTDEEKRVLVSGAAGSTFYVIDQESGNSVFDAKLGEGVYDEASGMTVSVGDFSQLQTPGTYRVYVPDLEGESAAFAIADDVNDELYRKLVQMLYLQRCGTAVDGGIAGDFAHEACHMQQAVVYGTDEVRDVSGGWHDAGDYGRYVVSGAKTIADLFLAVEYEEAVSDDLGIPESGNGVPDLLDEARWQLEWMLKMQDETSGGVYHKVTGYSFPGFVMPTEETDELVIAPISTTATGDFAAVMAKASVLYRPYDEAFAGQCLEAAQAAWGYLTSHEAAGFTNPDGVVTGEYGDSITSDELFWAAAELALAGADLGGHTVSEYLTDDLSADLGWADIGAYAMYDLAMAAKQSESTDEANESVGDAQQGDAAGGEDTAKLPADLPGVAERSRMKLIEEADRLKTEAEASVWSMSLGTDYPWGSNMSVANYGMLYMMACRLTGEEAYQQMAARQRDYLLGANPTGYCYVTGFGEQSPQHPHHRPSVALGKAMPGMLVGGPDSRLEDPYAQSVLSSKPAALCYVDNDQSYSTNEITTYWNSPLIMLLAALH